jgi:hypothetical protein
VAVGTSVEYMVEYAARHLATASLVVARITLRARRLGVGAGRSVGLDERRRVAALVLQLGDTRERNRQLLLELGNRRAQFGILGTEPRDLIFKRHTARIAQV